MTPLAVGDAITDAGEIPMGVPPQVTMAPARFVDLTPLEGIAMAEYVNELEGPRGKMRIQWQGRRRSHRARVSP